MWIIQEPNTLEVFFLILAQPVHKMWIIQEPNMLEVFFLILAHPVYKMWIIQEPNTLELWNKLHFEEKKTESVYHV